MPELHHWLHVYADGEWQTPVAEHLDALERSGLGSALTSFHVGVVGPVEARAAVFAAFDGRAAVTVEAQADEGWEQVTLAAMHDWVQDRDGLLLYTHTKGASRTDPIDRPWRRDMTYHCVMEWERCVEALAGDHLVAGSHWITDSRSDHAGMFGGNFWWVRADLLRRGEPPKVDYRHRAEEWLGDLGRVERLDRSTVLDLCPTPIEAQSLHADW